MSGVANWRLPKYDTGQDTTESGEEGKGGEPAFIGPREIKLTKESSIVKLMAREWRVS